MSASFEEWVRRVFDHRAEGPEWYWDRGFAELWESLEVSDELTVKYLTRLFLETGHLEPYSLEQVAQGIWFLIGESSPAQPTYALLRPEIDLEGRVACILAMADFFRSFVGPAAPGPAAINSNPFHIACYMWWDIFPSFGGANSGEPEIHRACLKVMEEVLLLPSELCQISALHGLNHWYMHYAAEAQRTIDRFLADNRAVTARVREYALQAREGMCQ